MNRWLAKLIQDAGGPRPGVNLTEIAKVEQELSVVFPDEYVEFLKASNGIEGPIGKTGYIALFSLEEIREINTTTGIDEFIPGLILFASDGGSVSYAFDTRNEALPVVELNLEELDLNKTKPRGRTLSIFLEELNAE